jgi:hypothetical protein
MPGPRVVREMTDPGDRAGAGQCAARQCVVTGAAAGKRTPERKRRLTLGLMSTR